MAYRPNRPKKKAKAKYYDDDQKQGHYGNRGRGPYSGKSVKKQPKYGRRLSQFELQELMDLKEVFKFMDKDGNGTVDPDEIQDVLQKLGLELSEDEVQDVMASLDENGDGAMDFGEFVQMMDRRMSISSEDAEIEEMFKAFDKNNDGKITFDELKAVLIALGEELTDKDVMDLIKEADLNGDGVIDFEEFKIMMTRTSSNDAKGQLLSI